MKRQTSKVLMFVASFFDDRRHLICSLTRFREPFRVIGVYVGVVAPAARCVRAAGPRRRAPSPPRPEDKHLVSRRPARPCEAEGWSDVIPKKNANNRNLNYGYVFWAGSSIIRRGAGGPARESIANNAARPPPPPPPLKERDIRVDRQPGTLHIERYSEFTNKYVQAPAT
ncbi:hypothetical protein EVAR_103087_1 [Eumeta japonica]|uniref:Uncharacterized protein n=1 Tax=Eumeta variegata TaxID=151549 RepID=A0A4C1WQ58_EUMVA|nr:hypothetical protein EVAR_103087_1 [Eumeta japonica]